MLVQEGFETTTDVLIVGAGPVGMTLHLALRSLGVDSVLVDKHAAGLNTSRAAVIHARRLEVLEPLGVVPALLSKGIRTADFRVREADRILLHIGFEGLPSDYPYALMCPQDQTESVLHARLQDFGLDVERPVDFVSASDAGESITAELSDAEGRIRRVATRWLVGCDGAHSAVRACAGIGFDGGDYAETFVLADVRMDFPLARDEVSLFFSPRGLMVVAPLPEPDGRSTNRYRIVATVEDPKGEPSMSDVQTLLDARGPARAQAQVLELQWSSNFHIQHRVASEVFKGRVMLCGDAAHVHSPAGGQGMNTGIQDAVALAEPLRQALRQGHRDALVDWAAQRQKVAHEVVRMTHMLTRAATADSAIERSVRNAALGLVGHLPFIQHRLAARLAQLAQ